MELDRNTVILIIALAVVAWYFLKSKEKLVNLSRVGVKVFEHADFKGKSVGLLPGQYNLAQLAKLGMPNDSISSIQVMPGFKIRAFEHDNFQGRVLELHKSSNYIGNNWNDVISSIIITKLPPVGAIVYEHGDFKGKAVRLQVGKYGTSELAKLGMANDSISSIRVRPGFVVYAFEHDSGKGKPLILRKSVNYVGNEWNDRISSILVAPDNILEVKAVAQAAPTPIKQSQEQVVNILAKAKTELKKAEDMKQMEELKKIQQLEALKKQQAEVQKMNELRVLEALKQQQAAERKMNEIKAMEALKKQQQQINQIIGTPVGQAVQLPKAQGKPVQYKNSEWKNCTPWLETSPGRHHDWCRNDFGPTAEHIGQAQGGCTKGFGKGVCRHRV
ncbi:MAG: hypothetical protein RLZZ86_3456 [Cyanobacteriota bacterium]|jgi:hypothetical protein